MWSWVYDVEVGVRCGGGCMMWSWVYYVEVGVRCRGRCTMGSWVYDVEVGVLYTTYHIICDFLFDGGYNF